MTAYIILIFVSIALANHYNNESTSYIDKISRSRDKKWSLEFLKYCNRKWLLKKRLLDEHESVYSKHLIDAIQPNQHDFHYGQPFSHDVAYRDRFSSSSEQSTSSSSVESDISTNAELNINASTNAELNDAVTHEYWRINSTMDWVPGLQDDPIYQAYQLRFSRRIMENSDHIIENSGTGDFVNTPIGDLLVENISINFLYIVSFTSISIVLVIIFYSLWPIIKIYYLNLFNKFK